MDGPAVRSRQQHSPGSPSDMLILSRRVGESFLIGNDVRITVLSARGSQVRIGIDAPKDTPVHREEIYQRLQQGQLPSTAERPDPAEQ